LFGRKRREDEEANHSPDLLDSLPSGSIAFALLEEQFGDCRKTLLIPNTAQDLIDGLLHVDNLAIFVEDAICEPGQKGPCNLQGPWEFRPAAVVMTGSPN
jgi:hypothetical protein